MLTTLCATYEPNSNTRHRSENENLDDTEAEFCRLIGAFLLEFSQLETTIRMRLASAINLPDRYSDIIMSAFDFARLCGVTEAILTQQRPEDSCKIKKLFGDCQSLNQERVRAAHGLLAPIDQDDGLLRRLPLSGFPTPDGDPGAFLREAESYPEICWRQLQLSAQGADLVGVIQACRVGDYRDFLNMLAPA